MLDGSETLRGCSNGIRALKRGVLAGAKLLARIAPSKNAIQIGTASVVSSELPRVAEGEILEAAPKKHHHGHFVGLTCQM